jgi:phage terminase large subunit-like protein
MDDESFNPQQLLKLARQTMSSAERRRKFRKIDFWDASKWYPTQLKFFASADVHQRLIYGGNQTGKTICVAAETAWHLTGDYPPWWIGARYTKPIRAWAVGESTTLVRDSMQRQLCGPRNDFGTGMIPLESFAKAPVMVPGGTGAVDTIFVTHMTDGKVDGTSELSFKSFEMRREKLQSESVDLIWIDERPDEELFNELYARGIAVNGRIAVSYTPVGPGAAAGLTYRFLSEPSADRAVFRITSDEARHITASRREEIGLALPDSERETRLEGIPQLGAGPIFPVELLPAITKRVDDDDIVSWARWCCGIDFGYAGAFAAVLIAWNFQDGHIWVVDSFAMTRSSALYHSQRILSMCKGLRIPVAYPHDANVHDKGSGIVLKDQYQQYGLNMMVSHAVNHGSKMNNVEPALEEICELMRTGRMTIGSHNTELIEEMRHYHRDQDFRIVKQNDHLTDALRYAVMMKRQGRPRLECDGIGYGGMAYSAQRRQNTGPRFASGIDFDLHDL